MTAAHCAYPTLPAPAASISRQAARIERPWGLLAAIALGYAAYTLHTGWPLPPSASAAPAATAPHASVPTTRRHALLLAPRLVLKCTRAGMTTYTDAPCAAGADPEALLLP